MSDDIDDLDALLNELDAAPSVKSEPVAEEVEDITSVLDDVVVEDTPAPEPPAPVKKTRGRPRKVKAEETVEAEPLQIAEEIKSAEPETEKEIGEVISETDKVDEPSTVDNVKASESQREVVQASTEDQKRRDIYVLKESQVINGHIYRRGQKISYVKGDKFYNSQTDRHGNNWLDYVSDPEAQYAHFGGILFEADHWSGIPLGSADGIEHPGLALAISKFAQEEFERNGTPFA